MLNFIERIFCQSMHWLLDVFYRQRYLDTAQNISENFVRTFLLNGTTHHVPSESLLLPSHVLKDITSSIMANKTYCFDTNPGPYGWCATCKVRYHL